VRERIAIVGSGIGGLGCLRFLSAHHDVTVFDQDARPGGHAHTIDVPAGQAGATQPMDTGFMVFNEVTYPHLCRLFRELGVAWKHAPMSFSVRHDPTGIEWCGSSLRHLFAQKRNLFSLRFWRLLLQINRFNQLAKAGWQSAEAETTSLRDWCARHGLGADFLELYLIPMSSAVWSTPPEKMLGFPAAALLRFFHNHGFLGLDTQHQWLTPVNGSRTYVRALLDRHPAQLRLGVGVRSIRREGAQVLVASEAGEEAFDRVILASHADQSLALLADADAAEQAVLRAFAYNQNIATVHSDERPMPQAKLAWSAWNYQTWRTADGEATSTHYWMNALQGLTPDRPYFVTINHPEQIAPGKVLRTIPVEHPLFSLEALSAQGQVQGLNERPGARVHFAGAWQRYGFHEDGLWSAHRLCSFLLGRDAWTA
jgi:predicted NAD/FAD-binding protein